MNAATATPEVTPTQVLILAKALLSDESKWTKGAAARNARGTAVPLALAVSFCVLGATWRASSILCHRDEDLEYEAEVLLCRAGMTASFNDASTTTFADIHKKLDEAIALSMEASNEAPL